MRFNVNKINGVTVPTNLIEIEFDGGRLLELRPPILMNTYHEDNPVKEPLPEIILLEDRKRDQVKIGVNVSEIDGAPFSGNFAALVLAVQEIVLLINSSSSSAFDGAAIHKNIGGEISTIALKATPVALDLLLIEDSADSNNKKKVTVGSLASPAPVILSPPQITSNQDDYNPTGWAASDIVFLDLDANREVTGFEAVLGYNRKILTNINNMFRLKIKQNNGGSLAANRILCPDNKDYDLKKNGTVEMYYNDTGGHWQLLGPKH